MKNNQIKGFGDKINQLYKYYSNSNEILTLSFQVTEGCNLNCSYCYQHKKSSNKMNFETAKKTIDLLLSNDKKIQNYIDITKKNGIIIDFIGGEPFLEIDLISKISDYFIYKLIELDHPWLLKYKFSISTNGILYFDEKVQNYIKKHKNHLSLGITLDGNKELHDMCRRDYKNNPTYDKVLKAVQHYKQNYNKNLSTKLTLSPDNLKYLFDGIKNFIDLGFTEIHFNPVFENVWNIQNAKEYYYQLKKIIDFLVDNNLENKINLSQLNFNYGQENLSDKNWCGGTGHMLAVNHTGNFYPCIRYMESSLNEEQLPYIIGNLNDGIGSNNIEKERINLLNSITKTSQSSEKCLNCPIASGCAWCSGYNYQVYGTPNKRATFICEMHQARVLAIKYYANQINSNFNLNIPEDWALKIISKDEYSNLNREEN